MKMKLVQIYLPATKRAWLTKRVVKYLPSGDIAFLSDAVDVVTGSLGENNQITTPSRRSCQHTNVEAYIII
jgi:hypothetical protein